MSFLTYTSHPVLFAASVGGVTLGVALLLLPWKQISFGDSWSNSFLSSSGFNPSSSKEPIERENNCKVVSLGEMHIYFFPKYIAVHCSIPKSASYDILGDDWIGLLPEKFFKKGDKLTTGQQLNIQTWTTELNNDPLEVIYKTKFQSSQFVTKNSLITGKWKYGSSDIYDKTIDPVELEEPYSSERIYFVRGSKKR